MKQAQRVLSTYAVDLFGMASTLYELGGLIIMHDASGCNSTYDTHDEPRWYDTPGMAYISGLNETDTIQGNDKRLIDDIAEAARELKPRFIAIGGSPMPNAIGTDFHAIARLVEKRTSLPTIGLRTDGIHSYIAGGGAAYVEYARRFLKRPTKTPERPITRVNILGLTPLDFSVVGNATTIKKLLEHEGLVVQSSWSMGDTPEHLATAADADVNAVVSSTGFLLAQYMWQQHHIPYVCGIPIGEKGAQHWIATLKSGDMSYLTGLTGTEKIKKAQSSLGDLNAWKVRKVYEDTPCQVLLIGEPIQILSMKAFLQYDMGIPDVRLLCPMSDAPQVLTTQMEIVSVEDVIRQECKKATHIIADPIYARLLPDQPERFISFPHEAYSGRHYRSELPLFIGHHGNDWLNGAGIIKKRG